MRRARALVVAAALFAVLAMTACTSGAAPLPISHTPPPVDTDGPDAAFVDAGPTGVTIAYGDDWTLPAWVRPAPNSGLFSEDKSADDRVLTHSLDVSWRQLSPSKGAAIDGQSTGEAQGMTFASLDDQLADPGAFWMRIFASGVDWAPEWVADECDVHGYGPDYDGQDHLPIWNECVWSALMETYKKVFIDEGLAADPRLKFVYVPGAFTWAEYDYETINSAVEAGDLDLKTYLAWYDHAWTDLVTMFGDDADKLVFTGEDYPFGPFGDDDDLLAAQAVGAGLGIRTGITELSNFHLNEAPSYGSSIQPNGHMVVDESLPIHDGTRVVATENECYNDCGYETDDPYYAVRQSNLKALQLRMNWMYLVPGPSYLADYPEQWDWTRLSLGQTAATSPDAWAAFRDAEDVYWENNELGRFSDPDAWPSLPYVRNLERWLVQVDEPGSLAHRTEVDVHTDVFESDNGTAYEGLTTAVADGDTGFVLDVDERFASVLGTGAAVLKVTYLDAGAGSFTADTSSGSSAAVTLSGSGEWKTATLALPTLGEDHRIRLSLATGSDDLAVRFVRLVRVDG